MLQCHHLLTKKEKQQQLVFGLPTNHTPDSMIHAYVVTIFSKQRILHLSPTHVVISLL